MKRTGSAAKKSRSSAGSKSELKGRRGTCYVLCISNRRYPASLDLLKVYRSLKDDAARRDGFIRVIDESGEDYLYPKDYFVPIELPISARRALTLA
jgi:ribosomal protein L36